MELAGIDFGGLNISALRKLSDSLLARKKFRDFIRLAWPIVEPAKAYLPNWHVDAIAEHLQAVSDGKIRKLLINVPPGHAKSLIVSVLWPAWQWIDHPGWRAIFSSYAADLAMRDSVRCRALIESPWYREAFEPKWELSGDQNVKAWFENTKKGFRLSLGVGGKATGFRGDCLIVDDPLNARDQYSEAALHEATFWWDQVMSSRLNDPMLGAKVIIMQRLSDRDLAAHVLAQGGYEHLNLPTEFEPDRKSATSIGWEDPRKAAGELLFPDLFPREAIDEAKRDLGSTGFSAQHQQRPSPAEGGIIKRHWWKYWQHPGQKLPPITTRLPDGSLYEIAPISLPELHEMAQSWDCAFKDSKSSDYVVGQAWGKNGADRFLMDQDRARRDLPSTVDAVRSMTAKFPKAEAKFIEDKANGPAVIQSLKHEVSGLIEINPEGGKMARAAAVSTQIESGNVYLPHPMLAPWVKDFVEECSSFPNGSHDDQLDAATQLLRRWKTGPAEMFPDLRVERRSTEPPNALHVVPVSEQKDWWPRYVSAYHGFSSAAHWWVREPSGRLHVYRELVMQEATPEAFGAQIAVMSQAEANTSRMVPVWMPEQAFTAVNGKSVAALVAHGIAREIGANRAFLFLHSDAERLIQEPSARHQAIESRLSKMPSGFLNVTPLKGKEQNGWDIVRELLRWRDSQSQEFDKPDVEYARELAATDEQAFREYLAKFHTGRERVLPLLLISPECRALMQAMSGAVRSAGDEAALAQNGSSFVLQSLRLGALASREERIREPQEEFVGRRLDKLPDNASWLGREIAAQRAEAAWRGNGGGEGVTFSRVPRG